MANIKVALFAPKLSHSDGGIWQFYQWVAKQVKPEVPFLLFAPALLLEEFSKGGGEIASGIPFESFRSSIEATTPYRILENKSFGQICGLRIPFYRKLTCHIKRSLFDGNVVGHATSKLLKREGVNIIHNPVQWIQIPSVVKQFPYIINPHDYQHEYFPEYFTTNEIELRRNVWYEDQRNAAAVVVHSQQTRTDAVKFLDIPEERVFYAPYGPLDTFPEPDKKDLRQVSEEFSLPERFVFYPARTWPHKNHLTLLEAISNLKGRGIDVNVIFTNIEGEHGEAVKQKIIENGLEEQLTIVGRVSPEKMGALYRLSTMVVVPSRFEQNSGPVLEALHFGKAVAVSNIDEIALTLDGAGNLFDPCSVREIADSIDSIWSSEEAQRKAEKKIQERCINMSWEPFRKVYQLAYNYALR